MITRTVNGKNYIYDVPKQIRTLEHFESLIYGYAKDNKREELCDQPKLLSLYGPFYNGTKALDNGEVVAIIRYETKATYFNYD